MLSCRQVVGLASDLIDRRLRARDRLALVVHAAMCRGCRAYLAQMRLTVAVLCCLPPPAQRSR